MTKRFFSARPVLLLLLACGGLCSTSVQCGSKRALGVKGSAGTGASGGSAGMSAGNTGTNAGSTGANGGSPGTDDGGLGTKGGTTGSQGGASGGDAGSPGGTGAGGIGCTSPTSGASGVGSPGYWRNYEVTTSFPTARVAIVQKPGQLKFTKIVISDQFLAESCAIGDYNGDGTPDVSSGRIWYEGTGDPTKTFKIQHPFRDGHGPLPRAGAGPELNTGQSDDTADYPWDMDGDGDTDIINIAAVDIPEDHDSTLPQTGGPSNPQAAGTPNKIGKVQVHATAYWYENPGKAGLAGDPKWAMHLMHADVRAEQHGLVDMNGDGYPEIFGACRDCGMGDTKGYYEGDPTNPTCPWTYHQVTGHFTFPFGNEGILHGMGAGDVNGDGLPDLLDRTGVYLQQRDAPRGTWSLTICNGRDTPAGCGWIQQKTPLLPVGFSQLGLNDTVGNIGPSHMIVVDMDMDGCPDVVAADWAHGSQGLWWYQQQKDANGLCNYAFNRYQFMGDSLKDNAADVAKWGAGFTVPHALHVYDMDGDGRPDVISGKMRFALPYNQGNPDPDGTPYLYVFKNVATLDSRTGAPITLQPVLVDGDPNAMAGTTDAGMGVGRQIAIGHVNTDGIMDICVATKVGLAVFLGQ
jgi:hypothetical protein